MRLPAAPAANWRPAGKVPMAKLMASVSGMMNVNGGPEKIRLQNALAAERHLFQAAG
jgi:hypothetical protein